MSTDFKALARPGVQNLAPYVPGKPVEELQRELGLERIVKLASNENPLGASPAVAGALQRVWSDVSRYPDGNGYALKKSLAQHLKVESDQITVGNGSNDVLEMLARAFVSDGDEVVFSQHAFAVYPIVTQAVGGVPVVVPAVDFGHDLDAMASAVTERTRLVFLANPNNPTGTWFNRASLESFLSQVPERVLVVLDEAYFEYVQQPDYPDGLELMAQYDNLVVTRTFSKIYGLASLRVGYCIANAGITDVLNRVRQPFNVNAYAQAAAVVALGDKQFVRQSIELNAAGKRDLAAGLQALNLDFIPSEGNFITFMVNDAAAVYDALLHKGVIVRPVAGYEIPNGLRVTIGTASENRIFLTALKHVLTGN
ncbi:MAG: histidinol-phosphate transaminase [Natronospirillum sp.]